MQCRMLKTILLRDKMLMSRLGIALGSLLWSVQLLFTHPIFVTRSEALAGAGRETYRLMTLIAPEWLWGSVFAAHAAFAFYTLFSGRRSKMLLVGDGVMGMLLWTASTIACYLSHWNFGVSFIVALQEYRPPAAMSGSVVIALYAWWHMIRLWAEEDNHKLPCSAKN